MTRSDQIVDSIVKKSGVPQLLNLLVGLPESELQSLLLKVFEERAGQITAGDIARQFEDNRFVQKCDIEQKELLDFDRLIYSVLPREFKSAELSPVVPLCVNSVLGRINQKNVLSTIRNVEVIGDITTALALVCANERKALLHESPRSTEELHLCTSLRTIRLQQFVKSTGFTPHFRVFGACSAGRDVGSEIFHIQNLSRHVQFYLEALRLAHQNGYHVEKTTVAFSDIRIIEKVIEKRGIERREVTGKTQEGISDFFRAHDIALPAVVENLEEIQPEAVNAYELHESMTILSKVQRSVMSEWRSRYPDINFCFDLERTAGIGYYENVCFKIRAANKAGREFPLADGGTTNWTQKLLANRKERLFASGFGTELFCRNFKS